MGTVSNINDKFTPLIPQVYTTPSRTENSRSQAFLRSSKRGQTPSPDFSIQALPCYAVDGRSNVRGRQKTGGLRIAPQGWLKKSLGDRCLCRGQRVFSGPYVDTPPRGASSNTQNRQPRHPDGRDPRRLLKCQQKNIVAWVPPFVNHSPRPVVFPALTRRHSTQVTPSLPTSLQFWSQSSKKIISSYDTLEFLRISPKCRTCEEVGHMHE